MDGMTVGGEMGRSPWCRGVVAVTGEGGWGSGGGEAFEPHAGAVLEMLTWYKWSSSSTRTVEILRAPG